LADFKRLMLGCAIVSLVQLVMVNTATHGIGTGKEGATWTFYHENKIL